MLDDKFSGCVGGKIQDSHLKKYLKKDITFMAVH